MISVNLKEKLKLFNEHWTPKIVSQYNGNDIMVAKFKGEYPWHSHPETDDLFYVIKGELIIQLRDGDVHLSEGELYVVPAGVEHSPLAKEEVHAILIEPIGTPNSGDEATAAKKVKI